MADTTVENPYDAEIYRLNVRNALRKLSENQAEVLLATTITVEDRYRVGHINDERTRNALARKGIAYAGTATAFGKDVIEALFQERHGKSVREVRAIEKATLMGNKMRRMVKAMKFRKRCEAVAPLLEGMSFYVWREDEYVDTNDPMEALMEDINRWDYYREPKEPTVELSLSDLERIMERIND